MNNYSYIKFMIATIRAYQNSFAQSPADGHLNCSQFVVNSAPIIILVEKFLYICLIVSLG